MNKTRATLLLAALLCGALGFVLGRWQVATPARPTWLSQVKDELGLRPDQVASLDRLLAEQDADLAALVAEHRDRLRGPVEARMAQTETELLAVLDQEQRERYEQLVRDD